MIASVVKIVFYVCAFLAAVLLVVTNKPATLTSRRPNAATSAPLPKDLDAMEELSSSSSDTGIQSAPLEVNGVLPDTPATVGSDEGRLPTLPSTEILVVLGWRPRLLVSQVLHLRGIGWVGRIVFLCPLPDDVVTVNEVFNRNTSAYGITEAFYFPVTHRVSLLNGRYFLVATLAYVRRLAHNTSTLSATRIIAVDATRTVWCHDLFRGSRERRLTFAASAMKPQHYYWKRMAQSDIFAHLPAFASEKPSKPSIRAVGSRRRMVVFSHIIGGLLTPLSDALKAIVDKISHVSPGLAIEPFVTDVIVSSFMDGSRIIPSVVPSRNELCFGNGVNEQVRGTCSPSVETTKVRTHKLTTDGTVVAAAGTVVLNFLACGPFTPRWQRVASPPLEAPQLMPPEGQSPAHCRRIFTNGSVVSVQPPPHPRRALISTLVARKSGVVSTWKGFTYRAHELVTRREKCSSLPPVDVILGVAFGYTPSKLSLFVKTFLQHHRTGTTKLVLFVKSEHVSAMRAAFNSSDVIAVDGWPYLLHKSPIAGCNIVLSRVGMMRNYLRVAMTREPLSAAAELPPEGLQCMRNVLVVDTRDTVFQRDPFDAIEEMLAASRTTTNPANGVFVMPMERLFLGESDFFYNSPYRLNRLWVLQTFGAAFFHKLIHEPITGDAATSDGVTFPILCGGLYMGTIDAIVDFFDVFVASAVALGGCGVNDQGLLIGLVAVGLAESRFPHPVLLSDPYTTPFTNGPRGGGEIIWDAEGRVVNCHGAPYAVMHQYTHLDGFVEHFTTSVKE